jgi:hypothetical protein
MASEGAKAVARVFGLAIPLQSGQAVPLFHVAIPSDAAILTGTI